MRLTAENCYSKEVKRVRQRVLKLGVSGTGAKQQGCAAAPVGQRASAGWQGATGGRQGGDGLVAARGTPDPAGPRSVLPSPHLSAPAPCTCPFPARFHLTRRICSRWFQMLQMCPRKTGGYLRWERHLNKQTNKTLKTKQQKDSIGEKY